MFHLPEEIKEKIYSYDPTYKDQFKIVMSDFLRCINCGLWERIEFEHEDFDSYGKPIKKNCSYFQYCDLDCLGIGLSEDTSLYRVWNSFTFCYRE